jgi:hypothetical protein
MQGAYEALTLHWQQSMLYHINNKFNLQQGNLVPEQISSDHIQKKASYILHRTPSIGTNCY